MKKNKNKFTWADLKKAANKVPAHLLKKEVVIWAEDGEKGYTVTNILVLEEDYVYDGDEGCCPKSIIKNSIEDDEKDTWQDDHYVIHTKGTRIISTD